MISLKTFSKRSLRTVCSEVFVLILASFVYSIAFPGFISENGIGIIAFLVLIPVFMVIRNTTWPWVGPYGFLFGFMYYLFFNYWLKTFHPLAILLVPIIKGGEMFFLFYALKGADRLFKKYGYVLQAVIWVAYSYLLETWFAGYPYGTICYATWNMSYFIQSVDVFGIWGIIFLMVLPQSFLGSVLLDKIRNKGYSIKGALRSNVVVIAIYVVLMIANLVYGAVRVSQWRDREPDMYWRVATVQHNHDSWAGGLQTYRKNFNNLRRYTLEAVRENPDIVIWSETAFVPSIDWNRAFPTEENEGMNELIDEFVDFAETLGVPLLTGNADGEAIDPEQGAYLEDGTLNRKDYNSVILFDDGTIKTKYRKQHLVPFTEHFPYEKTLPWLYNILLANDYNWWEKGTEPVVFETEGIRFSTPICFEDVFGYLSAGFVRNGADVIVNMTNDNWSKSEAAARQHEYIAVFRSIENRKSTVRGTNSGMTCMITPDGRIHEEMKPFTMGYHIYEVPVYTHESYPNTFYTDCTDLFAHIAVWVSAAALALGLLLRGVRIRSWRKQQ